MPWFVPSEVALFIGPGIPQTFLPNTFAQLAVESEPDRWAASTTTTSSLSAAIIRFLVKKFCFNGFPLGAISLTTAPF